MPSDTIVLDIEEAVPVSTGERNFGRFLALLYRISKCTASETVESRSAVEDNG